MPLLTEQRILHILEANITPFDCNRCFILGSLNTGRPRLSQPSYFPAQK